MAQLPFPKLNTLSVQEPYDFLNSIAEFPASLPLSPGEVTTDFDALSLEYLVDGLVSRYGITDKLADLPRVFTVRSLMQYLTVMGSRASDWFEPSSFANSIDQLKRIEAQQIREFFKKIILFYAEHQSWVFLGRMHPGAPLRFIPLNLMSRLDVFVGFTHARYEALEFRIQYICRRDDLSYCQSQIPKPFGPVSINGLIEEAKSAPHSEHSETVVRSAEVLCEDLQDDIPRTDDDAKDYVSDSYQQILRVRTLIPQCYREVSSSQLELVQQTITHKSGKTRESTALAPNTGSTNQDATVAGSINSPFKTNKGGRPGISPFVDDAARTYFSKLGWPEEEKTESLKAACGDIALLIGPHYGHQPAWVTVRNHLRKRGFRDAGSKGWNHERIRQLYVQEEDETGINLF